MKIAARRKKASEAQKSKKSAAARLQDVDVSNLESAAGQISQRIREVHMPYGTMMDPVFASPDSDELVSYTRTGDSAIWTGHYIAAEAFRYAATANTDALANLKAAIEGIRNLVDITGSEVLARVAVPNDSPYSAAIQREEGGHGVFPGQVAGRDSFWIGNSTRDQYSGVLFGLGVAMDVVSEDSIQQQVKDLVVRLVGYLVDHAWTVRMPNGKISTVFVQRPDQQLAFLQIARKAAPDRFGSTYKRSAIGLSALIGLPIGYDLLDTHHSYFKFNLDTINMYGLIRFESDRSSFRSTYLNAYKLLRRTTDDHQNAHFNMIDHAISGPNMKRDQETIAFLQQWLERPRRDPFVDLRGVVKAVSDDRAAEVIPIPQRPTTDFLWQRSPFQLYGGGAGLVEGAGIDFILPYWMARFFKAGLD